ncbi:DgyrCDS7861 [Dimorphilus gyrociliatus]|uniref:DgyrCDS7861 n=1 Tax=Dimorphilus gyrociliatus TaxID=2664684 RepID=A0A7I8VU21_9ANNE|nr:DgyrCDS7861 [Dimorphilus gyrociliatus]
MQTRKVRKEEELSKSSSGNLIKRLFQVLTWHKSSTGISQDKCSIGKKDKTVLEILGFHRNDVEIGRGSTAIVLSGYSIKTGKEVAIKIYDKARLIKKGRTVHFDKFIKRELRITSKVSHTNIVKCVAGAETANRVYIIMERLSGRTVRDEVTRHFRLPEPVVGVWIAQLAKAIDYLHNKGIAHRDIKCSNLLLDKHDSLKLSDFGVATDNLNDPRALGIIWSTTFVGNLQYAAPEVLLQREYVATKADLWSIGIVLYVCLRGHFPFPGTTPKQVYYNIKRGLPKLERIVLTDSCERLIQSLLRTNISERFDSSRLVEDEFCKRFEGLEIDDVRGLDSNVDNSFCDEVIRQIEKFDIHPKTGQKFLHSSVDKPDEKGIRRVKATVENLVKEKSEFSKTDSHTESRASFIFCSISEMTLPSQTFESTDKSAKEFDKDQGELIEAREDCGRLTPNTMEDSQRLNTDECRELYENNTSSEVIQASENSQLNTEVTVQNDKGKEVKIESSSPKSPELKDYGMRLRGEVDRLPNDTFKTEENNQQEIHQIPPENASCKSDTKDRRDSDITNEGHSLNFEDLRHNSGTSLERDREKAVASQLHIDSISYSNSKKDTQTADCSDHKEESIQIIKSTVLSEFEEKSDRTDLKDELSDTSSRITKQQINLNNEYIFKGDRKED